MATITHAVFARSQHRRARRRTCSRRSPRRRGSLPSSMPDAADAAQGEPGRRADHEHRAVVGDACRCRRSTSTPRICSHSRSRRSAASRRSQVYGSQQYAVRIQLDPNALATRGIALTDVEQAVGNSNVNLPTGTLYGRDKATSVQATGQLMNAAGLRADDRRLPQRRAGAPERDRPRVRQRAERQDRGLVQRHARRSCSRVQRQPGTNTIEIVDAIRKILPTFESQLPPAIKLNVFYDRSVSIRDVGARRSDDRCCSRWCSSSR